MSAALPIAAATLLTAFSLWRRPPGSRAVSAYKTLREKIHGESGDIAEFYPETAAGRLKPGPMEEVFWTGYAGRRIGYVGPSDGTMVPIDARYLIPTQLNIFSTKKLAALVSAIREGRNPLVYAGMADPSIVDKLDVKEGRKYAGDTFTESLAYPYEDSDVGALAARMYDGNHRSFAALVAGAPFTWVQISRISLSQILEDTSQGRRLYLKIRKAQQDAGAPMLTKPRKRLGPRATSTVAVEMRQELAEAELEYIRLKADIEYAHKELLKSFHHGGSVRLPLREQLEKAEMFLRKRVEQAMALQDDKFLDRYFEDPLTNRLSIMEGQRSAVWSKIWDLKVKLGIDPMKRDS